MKRYLALAAIVACLGCGSDSDDGLLGDYEVNDVRFFAGDIRVGESVRTDVFFETKTDITGDPDAVRLVVHISPELRYVEGTSEIYDNTLDERDAFSPDQIVDCPDGSTFLVYNFNDSDLEDRAIEGNDSFGIRFQSIGRTRRVDAYVEAAAGENQSFSCNAPFGAEENAFIEVQ